MTYYYTDNTNQPVGPVPLEQLHALARDGAIGLDTHILLEGSEEWQQYRSLIPLPPPLTKTLVPVKRHTPIIEVTSSAREIMAATATCPFCAESIAPAAKKCKHCGEILDVTLRAAEEAKRMSQNQPNVYMNAGGGVVSGVGTEKHNFPHLLHLLVTLVTVGFWSPVWFLHYIGRDRRYYW